MDSHENGLEKWIFYANEAERKLKIFVFMYEMPKESTEQMLYSNLSYERPDKIIDRIDQKSPLSVQ